MKAEQHDRGRRFCIDSEIHYAEAHALCGTLSQIKPAHSLSLPDGRLH